MIEQAINWLPLLLQIGVHEAGHYLAFRAVGIRPKIKLTWWGVLIGEGNINDLFPYQSAAIASAGVYTGWVFLFMWDRFAYSLTLSTFLMYFVVCAIDFSIIISCLSLHFDDKNLTIRGHLLKEAKT